MSRGFGLARSGPMTYQEDTEAQATVRMLLFVGSDDVLPKNKRIRQFLNSPYQLLSPLMDTTYEHISITDSITLSRSLINYIN